VAVQITVAAYNAAGEEVDTIYQGGTEYLPTNVSLSGDLIVDGTQGVQVNLNTPLSGSGGVLSWNGINNNGQYVGSGIYYIRTTYVNTFGMATSYIDSVQVLANPGSQDQITIFNSAGEVVWQGPLPTGVLPSLASQPLSLTSSALALALNASGSLQAPLGIKVGSNIEYWNGLNMQGQLVSPGTYSVVLSDALPGSSMDVQTKQFQAVASSVGLPSAAAVIVPNPWRGDVSLALLYTVTPGYFGEAVLYDLAGEIVARSEDPQAMGKLTFNRQKLAGGIYLLDFRQMDGPQITTHKTYKLAVVE